MVYKDLERERGISWICFLGHVRQISVVHLNFLLNMLIPFSLRKKTQVIMVHLVTGLNWGLYTPSVGTILAPSFLMYGEHIYGEIEGTPPSGLQCMVTCLSWKQDTCANRVTPLHFYGRKPIVCT